MDRNIARILRTDNHGKVFQALQSLGLIDYSRRGYESWHRQYIDNPDIPVKEQNVPAWIYYIDAKAVGHLGAIPVRLRVGGHEIQAAWAVDFKTSAEYRRRGIGESLLSEANKDYSLLLAIGASDMSFGLFKRLGWEFLGELPHYVKIYDIKRLMEDRIKNRFILNLVVLPLSLLYGQNNFFRKKNEIVSICVEKIDNFDAETDQFWNETADSFKVIVARNRAYLSWKFDMNTDMRYVKFRAVRQSRLCGYAVARCIESNSGYQEGLIVDLIAQPSDTDAVRALILAVSGYLKEEGCSIIRCYSSSKDIQKLLSACGFIRRKSYLRFLINKNAVESEGAANFNNWYLTAGDSDIDRK